MSRPISRAQMGRLHATGAEHGLSHDDLRARAAHLLGWGDDPATWPSLSTLTTTQASWVTDHLVDRPRETRPDEISGRYQVVIRLGKSFEWQGRQVDRIEWSATIGEYGTVIHCYADRTDRDMPPVPHDQIPADWPRPPEGLVVWP